MKYGEYARKSIPALYQKHGAICSDAKRLRVVRRVFNAMEKSKSMKKTNKLRVTMDFVFELENPTESCPQIRSGKWKGLDTTSAIWDAIQNDRKLRKKFIALGLSRTLAGGKIQERLDYR